MLSALAVLPSDRECTAVQSPRGTVLGQPCGPRMRPSQAATAAGNRPAFCPAGALWRTGAVPAHREEKRLSEPRSLLHPENTH